jgi:hypothetical protein
MTRMLGAASLEDEAVAIHLEDRALNQALGRHGAPLLDGGVLTICNTGSLATGGHGTALGMVRPALAMGLVNKVVPHKDLRAEVERWCAELLEKSPTALALAKQSFNVDSEQRAGVAQFAGTALNLYYQTEEAMEGRNAFVEKRPVNFGKFRT